MKKEQFAKIFQDNKKSFDLLFVFFILGFIFILSVIFFKQGKLSKKSKGKDIASQIKIQDGDNLVTINDNGMVEFNTPTKTFYQTWDSSKVKSVFKYLEEKAKLSDRTNGDKVVISITSEGGSQSVNIDRDDEELNSIFQAAADSGGEDDSLDDYFDFSSPTPPAGGSSEDDDSPGGSGGGGSSGGGGTSGGRPPTDEDCPFWLLSYCVYPPDWNPPPTSSPLPTVTPNPSRSRPPAVEECTLWDQLINERTVISQNVCLRERGE